tara:strand:- start:6352 stop:6582 length:231 start_codon:yes stop_codon:yes gene_type:complete
MSNASEAIYNAKENIKKELDMCNKEETPFLCSLIGSERGYKQAEIAILYLIGERGFTISMAIAEQERLLNPRYTDD